MANCIGGNLEVMGFVRINNEIERNAHLTKLGHEERRLVLEWKFGMGKEGHSPLGRRYSHNGVIV